ncbi:MAG TPA: ice-binding family protein, partial [Saprospiraceae bacterium]|nr:ice-binding family protein [Saprospiraceae bacterium]
VSLNKVITATFNTAMDSSSFTTSSFLVKKAGVAIAGSVWYFNGRAYFTPALPLISNTDYTAVLNRGIRNSSGTTLGNDYVWTFNTVNTNPPTIVSTDPLNNATGVSPASSIRAIFSTPMDPNTLNSSTFNLRQNGNIVPGTVSYTGVSATFYPNSPLLTNASYSATITQAAKDLSGRPLAADHMWSFSTRISGQPEFVNLNSATRFGVFAGSGIINQAGFSEIHDMDLGIHPGNRSSVTGFPPGLVFNGFIYASNDILPAGTSAMLLQARSDLNTAYLFAKDAILPTPQAILGDQGGKTLLPGIYKSASNFLIANGNLRLDAQGDPNAVWIFQVGSDLTTVGSNGGSIILAGGARASNIFWQVGGTATVGDNSAFQGNILAQSSVTMKSGATATGRMLSMNGAITLANSNIIRKP